MSFAQIARGLWHRALQIAHRIHHALSSLRIGGFGRLAFAHPRRGDHGDLAFHTIQHGHHRGAQHAGVGQTKGIGVDVGQVLDQPDHIIAQIAKQTRRGLWQVFGQVDAAFLNEGAQVGERVAVLRGKAVGIKPRGAVDAAFGAVALPDQIRLHAYNGVAPAHFATGHRFQHKGVFMRAGEFQHERHGGVQIGGKPGIDNLILARLIGGGEVFKARGQVHLGGLSIGTARALRSVPAD